MSSKIVQNQSLLPFNTFNIQAYASHFLEIKKAKDYSEVLENTNLQNARKLILGSGSNILFSRDFTGLVIKNSVEGISIQKEDDDHVYIEVGGGVVWDNFVKYCVENGYGGVENLAAIPGTVGAAPVQNIGAYGVELRDVFYYAMGFYLCDMEIKKFYRGDCEFSYRESIFKKKLNNEFFITQVVFKLNKNHEINLCYGNLKEEAEKLNKDIELKDIYNIVKSVRGKKLPDIKKYGNAGSFFKNPVIGKTFAEELKRDHPDLICFKMEDDNVKIPAGWLIEKTGWKGSKFGNVGCYKNQALVIVNYGEATGNEIISFAHMVRESVEEKFRILLEEEVNIF